MVIYFILYWSFNVSHPDLGTWNGFILETYGRFYVIKVPVSETEQIGVKQLNLYRIAEKFHKNENERRMMMGLFLEDIKVIWGKRLLPHNAVDCQKAAQKSKKKLTWY